MKCTHACVLEKVLNKTHIEKRNKFNTLFKKYFDFIVPTATHFKYFHTVYLILGCDFSISYENKVRHY